MNQRKNLIRIFIFILAASLTTGCETDDDQVVEPESEEVDENAEDNADEDALLKPEEAGPPRFEFSGPPLREELHRLEITARKDASLELRDEAASDGVVVDHLVVKEGQAIETSGEHRFFVTPRIREAEQTFEIPAESHESGPEPGDTVVVEVGDEFAIAGRYHGEGMFDCLLWHQDTTYSHCPEGWIYEFPYSRTWSADDDAPVIKFDDHRGESDGWWMKTEGSKTTAWLRVDREELHARLVIIESYR